MIPSLNIQNWVLTLSALACEKDIITEGFQQVLRIAHPNALLRAVPQNPGLGKRHGGRTLMLRKSSMPVAPEYQKRS